MKRTFSFDWSVIVASGALIALAYGLVRFGYGLLLPAVQAELGLSDAAAGGVSAGASLAYCAAASLAIAWGSRGPGALVAAAAGSAGAGAIGMGVSADAGAFAAWAVAASAGAGFASPAVVAVIDRAVSERRRDRAQLAANAGTGPGLAVAGALVLASVDWRAVWIGSGTATIGVAAVLLVLGRTGRDGRPDAARAPVDALSGWLAAHRRPLVAAASMGAGSTAVWTYGRVHLEAGASEGASVAAWIAIGVGGTAAALLARPVAAVPPRLAWLVSCALLGAAGAGLAAVGASAAAAILLGGAFGAAYVAATGALIAWSRTIDPQRAPTGTALLFVAMMLGQAVGAALAGANVEAVGIPVVLVVGGAVAAAAGAIAGPSAVGSFRAFARTAAR